MRHLYSALLYVLLPFALLRLLWRSRALPGYRRRIPERFGLFPGPPAAETLWVHAASVGEVLAAAPLVEALLATHPRADILVTTATPTGSACLLDRFGGRVRHCYVPWDLPGAVRRFLARARPRLLVLVETELWPNLIHFSRARGCRIVLANARLSPRSAERYLSISPLVRPMLEAVDVFACQSEAIAGRFRALGAQPSACRVTGSLKFDIAIDDTARARAAALGEELQLAGRDVVVAGSTHPGEEAFMLAAFAALRGAHDDCLLVLAPRHPERCGQVAERCRAAGWRTRLRSAPAAGPCDVLLLDTVGELALLYSAATVAFVGGSLVDRGGHNVVEAAAWGAPVVCGPHTRNFHEAVVLLVAAGGLRVVRGPDELGPALGELLASAERREAMGAAGRRVVEENRGALQALQEVVAEVLAADAPTSMPRSAGAAAPGRNPGGSRPPG